MAVNELRHNQKASNDLIHILIHSYRGVCFETFPITGYIKMGDGDAYIPFQLKSDSLPHAHAQTTKTYYKH
ncbi:hypothetical protein Tco_1269492 [Tanacetum coccineum]